jgi:acetyl esterase/lipase
MADDKSDISGALHLDARVIPVPKTISPKAQESLANPTVPRLRTPKEDSKAAWKECTEADGRLIAAMVAPMEQAFRTNISSRQLTHATLYDIVPDEVPPENRHKAILYLHGGGFVVGGGRTAAIMALPLACGSRSRLFSCDYRMPPDHPYPAALDDCVEAYQAIIKDFAPGNVAIAGNSAGGNLAAATVLKLRDLGLPLPAGVILHTPAVDLTESGDSFQTNQEIDVVLGTPLPALMRLYAGGHDLTDPYVSPLYGDFSKGFAPTLLLTGTRDLLLSNTVMMHRALRRAGIEADLQVFEAMPHSGFRGAPEDAECLGEQIRFIHAHLGHA